VATGTKPDTNDAASPTREFFEALADRGQEPLLTRITGTIRFDLGTGKDVERWYVRVRKGRVDVSHKKAPADAVVRADKALFDDIAAGKANAMAAALRGMIVPEGDLGLVMTFQRLFPGPPKTRSKSAGRRKR
jgi:putative sterol carrier protein